MLVGCRYKRSNNFGGCDGGDVDWSEWRTVVLYRVFDPEPELVGITVAGVGRDG